MRKILLTVICAAAAVLLNADVVMVLKMQRDCCMLYEPVIAELTMRNTTGQVLVFGSEAEFKGSLEVELTDMHDRPLPGSGAKIALKGLILRPGIDQRIRINLSKWVNLNKQGYYKLKLFIAHPMLKNEFESNPVNFDISYGTVYWSRTFGVPQLTDNQSSAEDRTYTIRAMQDKSEIFLFLFVEDSRKIYTIKRLGIILGREKPACELDSLNQLHILRPITPKIYQYQVYDWDGTREVNRIYRRTDRTPILYRDPSNGNVKVIGGEIARSGVDYTEEKLLPGVPVNEDIPVAAPKK